MSYQSYTYSSSTQPFQRNSSSPTLFHSTYSPTKFPTYKVDGSFPYHAISMTSSTYDHDKPKIIVTGSSPKQTHHSARSHDPLSFYPSESFNVASNPSTASYDPNYLSPKTYINKTSSTIEKPKSSAFRSSSPPKKIDQNGTAFKHTTHAANHIDVGPYSHYSSSFLTNKSHSASQPLLQNYIHPVNPTITTNSERHKKLIFENASPSDKAPKSDRIHQDSGWKTGLIDHTFSPPKNPHTSNHVSHGHGHESHTTASYYAPSYETGHGDIGKTREFNFEISKPKTEYTTKSLITRFIDSDDLIPSARDSYQKPVKSIKDAYKAPQISTETYKQSIGLKEFSPESYRPKTTQAATSSTINFAQYHDLLSSVKEPEPTGLQDFVIENHIEAHKEPGFGPHLGSSAKSGGTAGVLLHTVPKEFSYEYTRPQTTQAAKSTSIFGHSDHFAPPARESFKIFSMKEKSPEVPKQSGFGLARNDFHSHHSETHTRQPYHNSMKNTSPERTREFTYVRQKPQTEREAKSPMRFIDSDDLLPSARTTYQKPKVTKAKSKKSTFDNQDYYLQFANASHTEMAKKAHQSTTNAVYPGYMIPETKVSFAHQSHDEGVKRASAPSYMMPTSQSSHPHNVGPASGERQRAKIFNVDRPVGADTNGLARVYADNDPSRNLVSVPPKVDHTSHQIPLTTSPFSHSTSHGTYGTHGVSGTNETHGIFNDYKYDYYRPNTGLSPAKTSESYKSSVPYSHGTTHFNLALDKHTGLTNVKNPSSYDSPRRGNYGYLNSTYGGAETARY